MSFWKRDVPWILMVASAFIMYIDFFIPAPVFANVAKDVRDCGLFLANFALGIGLIDLTIRNVQTVKKRIPKQWPYSATLLVVMGVSLIFALFFPPMTASSYWRWIQDNMFYNASVAIGAVTSAFFWSVAFRGIIIRKPYVESLLFAGCTIVLLIANSPLGEFAAPWAGVLGVWLMNYPVMAVFRGIAIGIAVSLIAWAVRALAHVEAAGV